jgi:hypothetical protein
MKNVSMARLIAAITAHTAAGLRCNTCRVPTAQMTNLSEAFWYMTENILNSLNINFFNTEPDHIL